MSRGESEIITTIAEYSPTAKALAELKAKFQGIAYDVTTTAGMDTAKKDRRELVTLRTDLEKKRKEIKAPALERCNAIDAEAKRITAEILQLEGPIDEQIKAEEERKEAIKAEKARQAAEAQKILDDKILAISKLPLSCIGRTSEEIALFLATLEAREFGGEFTGETRERAEQAKKEAVAEIREIYAVKVEEEENARLAEIERKEREAREAEERKAREEEEARLAAEREELRKEREKFEAEQAKARQEKEEAERKEREKREAEEAEQRRIKEQEEAAERKRLADEAAAAEKQREEAEKARRAEARARKLAEAKTATATDALKKILDICQSEEHTDTGKVTQIALIAEANIA